MRSIKEAAHVHLLFLLSRWGWWGWGHILAALGILGGIFPFLVLFGIMLFVLAFMVVVVATG